MSTFVDATSSAIEHLDSMSTLHPDLSSIYTDLSSLLSRKLYHQLTVQILSFVSNSSNLRSTQEGGNSFLALYDKVLLLIDKKLNQLTLARIASSVSHSLLASDKPSAKDGIAAKAILENLLEKKDRLGVPATVYAESKLHLLGLNLMESSGTVDTLGLEVIKEMLERNKSVLAELAEGTESDVAVVHSAYYECAMTYRKAVGPPEAFYREAIQFLNYTPLDSLSNEKKYALATDLSLSALTGEGVYNFGEVVHNNAAILQCLEGTENQWLVKLMHASALGDVSGLDEISSTYAEAIRSQPALVSRAVMVKEKITLLALVNMVFERPSSERTLSFEDISVKIQMPVDHVELVIIRALSLGLIKGSMDQVDGTVDVTWVMPRVLDGTQMNALADRFGEWAVKVSKTREYMGEHVPTFG